mgnify:CR=1 FL=1
MQLLRDMGTRISIAGELLGYLWQMKMSLAVPMVLVLLVLGLLISFGTASGIGPLVYTLF